MLEVVYDDELTTLNWGVWLAVLENWAFWRVILAKTSDGIFAFAYNLMA